MVGAIFLGRIHSDRRVAVSLDALLQALDSDRDTAAGKYEDLRQRLMRVFRMWGSDAPDRDTDITLDRVASKILGGEEIRNENKYVYFHGVARFVFKEQLRARIREREVAAASSVPGPDDRANDDEGERRAACLDKCLGELGPDLQSQVLDYYDLQARARIDRRQRIADRLGLTLGALRVRMHRERDRLRSCVTHCAGNENASRDTISNG